MRYALALFAVAHGIAHAAGVVEPLRTTSLRFVWLAMAAGFAVAGIGVWVDAGWWQQALVLLSVGSLGMCFLEWPLTRFGIAANVAVLLVAFWVVGQPGKRFHDDRLEGLWRVARASTEPATPALPASVRKYLAHAIAPGAPDADRVRLKMHGEIKLGETWRPFTAEQVIVNERGMVWAAEVPFAGLSIRGSDRMVNGDGAMEWKFGGLIPVMKASGPDVTRSAQGRMLGELVWLPTALRLRKWTDESDGLLRLNDVRIAIDPGTGAIRSVWFPRWGNPDGGEYRYASFGVVAEQERRFGSFTIPSQIRAGWNFKDNSFEKNGEFFRASIDSAEFA